MSAMKPHVIRPCTTRRMLIKMIFATGHLSFLLKTFATIEAARLPTAPTAQQMSITTHEVLNLALLSSTAINQYHNTRGLPMKAITETPVEMPLNISDNSVFFSSFINSPSTYSPIE